MFLPVQPFTSRCGIFYAELSDVQLCESWILITLCCVMTVYLVEGALICLSAGSQHIYLCIPCPADVYTPVMDRWTAESLLIAFASSLCFINEPFCFVELLTGSH